jgi:hypothetical protein
MGVMATVAHHTGERIHESWALWRLRAIGCGRRDHRLERLGELL